MNFFNRYVAYGLLSGISAYNYFDNSYVPSNAIGARYGQLLDPGFHWRAPLSDTVFVLPRRFTADDPVDVTISWPGNGVHPLRVMMERVPLRVGETDAQAVSALNVVGKRNHVFTTTHAMFDPSFMNKAPRAVLGINRRRYFGCSVGVTDFFVANWTHLCRQAAAAASKKLSDGNFAPHVDVAIDVLIEELENVLYQQCGLHIDGHIENVAWEDITVH